MALKIGDVVESNKPEDKNLLFIEPGIVIELRCPHIKVMVDEDKRYIALEEDLKLALMDNVFRLIHKELQR